MIDLLERYNQRLRSLEDDAITRLHGVMDASFNRLVRRARIHLRSPYRDPAERELALLQEFQQLVPAFRPDRVDRYDRTLRTLLGRASRLGLGAASDLTTEALPERGRLDVSIPLDAVVAAAAQAKGYLRRHGDTFAETAATTVAQGLAEGRPTDSMVDDIRQRLAVTKSRATTIVRTESLRAYNTASRDYYTLQGIDTVLYYATSDDRTCYQYCAPRAGRIYRREDIHVPLHPMCRCYLAPWSADLAQLSPTYAAAGFRHREEVDRALRRSRPPEVVNLNRAAVFELSAPIPVA